MKKIYFVFLAIFIAGFSYGQNLSEKSTSVPLTTQYLQQDADSQLKSASATAPQDLSNVKEVVYLRTGTCGNYWGQNGNATALDATFGAGNWTRLNFEALNVPALLASNVKFIFIDGSNCGTCEFINFLNSYRTELEAWVATGKSLFLNAFQQECSGNINTITGVNLNLRQQGGSVAYAANNNHPVFSGPKTPAAASAYNGSSLFHNIVVGTGLSPILQYNNIPVLAEKDWGLGKIMFGGLSLEFIGQSYSWSPEPEISNLYSNILQYMYDAALDIPCINDIEQDNDPGECGAMVDYNYPDEWAVATVTQIDNSGLTSGDTFPVGVTTQSYQLVWDGGSGPVVMGEKSATAVGPPPPTDTCTFTVTVVDVEAPVITYSDTVVYSGSGECGTEVTFHTGMLTSGIAEEGITLPFQNNNGSLTAVAYNPIKKLYYAVQAGTSIYPLKTYDENGIELNNTQAGFDFRGLWWNPNTSRLEGNGYYGNGYRIVDLNINGYALSTGTSLSANNFRPNGQCQADYDFDSDEVIFYYQNNIYRTDHSTGTLLGSYAISGLPSYNLNTTFVGYTGIVGNEILVYNSNSKIVYLIDKATGAYSASVQLPATAPSPNYLRASYANGYIWLYDGTNFHSYKIFDDNHANVSDNCQGIDSIIFSSPNGSFFPVGETTVTVTAYDKAENVNSSTFKVTVVDTISPTIQIPSEITVSLDALGKAGPVVVNFIKALDSLFVSDNCGTAEVTAVSGPASTRNFTRLDVNQLFDLAVEATDESGNKRVVSTSIRIIDDIAPEPSCHPIDIVLDENGRYALTEADVAALSAGTSDNVDAYEDLIIETWPKAFGCEDVSDQFQIDVITTDKSGNKSQCWVYCTVTDPHTLTVDPIDDVDMDIAPGVCETKITYPEITTSSPCAIVEQVSGLGPDGMYPLGTTVETWKVYNTSGDTVEVSFNVTVTTTNGLPTFDALADVTVDEDSPAVNVPLSGISYGIDCRPQTISVTAKNGNTSLVTDIVINYNSPDATGSLDLTLAPDMSGTDTIEVVVADNAGGTVSEIFVLTVNEVNDPPTIDQIENVTVDEDAPVINVPLTGISGGPASEPQDVTITTTSSNATLLSGVVVNYNSPDATGSLDLTLAPDMSGVDSIRVTVVDSEGLSHSRTFVLTVNPVNDEPFVVNSITIARVNASYEITVTVSSILGELFDDVDDDVLTITTTLAGGDPLPTWVTIAGDDLTAAPMIADTGSYTFVVTATDAAGATATHSFILLVEGYPTDIGDLDTGEMEIKMYPNPTKGLVTVEFNSTNIYDVDLSVLDITGKLILRKQYSAAERISFDMSNQVSGMYFVKLGIDDKQIVKKLILDRK
jgi:hypothetical protein